jgi:transporter family-2 protein
LFSLAVDHYGFLLPEATPLSPIRIAGAVLLVISVAMIMAPKF